MNSIVCLMGPTAVGKSDLAIALARDLPIEIISVDSALVYHGMDIGTAKPSPEILARVPHHLINILPPSVPYSVAQFQKDVVPVIQQILQRKRLPLLVGGTMLYFRALQQGLAVLPSSNPEIRAEIETEAKRYGWPRLHQRVQMIDPVLAQKIKPHDGQRIQRALEVYYLTGQPMSLLWQVNSQERLPYRVFNIALLPDDRNELHQRIEKRFQCMLQHGFIDEVAALYQREDLHEQLPSMRCVGYRQIWHYLAGHISYTDMQEKAIAATRQLAKRQMTWLRHWPDTEVLDPFSEQSVIARCRVRLAHQIHGA